MGLQLLAQLLVIIAAVQPAQARGAAAKQQRAEKKDDQHLSALPADVQLPPHCVADSSALRSSPASSFHSAAVVSAVISKWCCTTRSRSTRRSASRSTCRPSMARSRPALRCASSTCFVAALRIFSRFPETASGAVLLDEQPASHPTSTSTASDRERRSALDADPTL